jgi:AraC-like DNA-binding protein
MRILADQELVSQAGPTSAKLAVSCEFSAALTGLLAEARAAVKRDPSAAEWCLDRLELLLAQTSSTVCDDERAAVRSGGLAPWQAARVKRYVDANLGDRLSTAELAKLVRLSGNHFSRVFKASLGCPPHEYIVRCRITRAKELMLQTDTPLSQIAVACGLADQAHLSRLFRRLVGASPSGWRRENSLPQQWRRSVR